MHAACKDLLHWEKVPEDTFYAPYRNPGEGIAVFIADGNAYIEEVTVYRPSHAVQGKAE